MFLERYVESKQALAQLAQQIELAKRPEYTGHSNDVLFNFKSIALRLKISPLKVWGVYFLKHIDAIISQTEENIEASEPLEERFADALNYLYLGYALMEERDNDSRAKYADDN